MELPATATATAEYENLITQLQAQYQAIPSGQAIRLAKRTSNLFRLRQPTAAPGLDVEQFAGVLHIDTSARTADVLGMTTYEDLVSTTLEYGLMPLVVPQLRTITLGGAVTGLGIESTSFRSGLPHESVLEMDILTGDGQIVTARPDNEHADLFYGFPNSYGTLGYALRLRIELQPVQPFVELEHVRFTDIDELATAIANISLSREYSGRPVDFLDGTVFDPHEMYLTLGRWCDQAPYTSDYTGMQVYYKSIAKRSRDYLTIADYLWRWDTDWFWCSNGLGLQKPWLRRLVPRKYLRSQTYFPIVAFFRRRGLVDRLADVRKQPRPEYVIQDIEVPVDQLSAFMDFFHAEVGIKPIWLCPLRLRDSRSRWDLYALSPDTTYINVGFWSSVPKKPGAADGAVNRAIEIKVDQLSGRKSLYSSSYYPEDEFWRIYNGQHYQRLKALYDPHKRLLDLYQKCVVGR